LKSASYLPYDVLIRQGDFGDKVYFLNSGSVEVLIEIYRVRKGGVPVFGKILDKYKQQSFKGILKYNQDT
jgi:hypothetical protein